MRPSGILLLVMSLWWLLPFFLLHLFVHPFLTHFRSHLLYLAFILISLLSAAVLSAVDGKGDLWERSGYWGRYGLLCGAYVIQTALVLAVVLTLDSLGLLGYYGGDPEGSAGMLILPTAAAYVVLGALAGGVLALARRVRGRGRSAPRADGEGRDDGA